MRSRIRTKVTIDTQKVRERVTSNEAGQKVAEEWKRLIGPFTPRDTGRTEDEAVVTPWTITYHPVDPESGREYAPDIYYGEDMNFQKINNPYATHHWDRAAKQAGQVDKLTSTINNEILK